MQADQVSTASGYGYRLNVTLTG